MNFLQILVVVLPLCWAAATVFICLWFRVRGYYNNRLK